MTNKTRLLLALAAFAMLATASCKKDDDEPEDRTALLVNVNWRMTSLKADPPVIIFGIPISDLYAQFDACDKDDITIFKSDGKVNYDEGATKCDPTDPQTTTGTWVFNTDKTVITLDGESWTIEELTKSKLRVKYTEDLTGSGVKNTVFATFEH